ncbi:MAG: YggT family protein [Caulobacterales bacterium]
MIVPFLNLIDAVLAILLIILVVNVVLSWLFAFDIVSPRNQFVGTVFEFTRRLTDPILRPIRKIIPPIAGVDLSVLVLMLLIQFIRELLPRLVLGSGF